MPLPRFDRLAPEARAAVLDVARTHFARDGFSEASYNRIIAEAGISKTSAYHYFDGKADLYGAVRADVLARLADVLGAWEPSAEVSAFWQQFHDVAGRLADHLARHPDDRVLLAAEVPPADAWTPALIEDAVHLGLVRAEDREIMIRLTGAVLAAVDEFVLARPETQAATAARLPTLLTAMWSTGQPGAPQA